MNAPFENILAACVLCVFTGGLLYVTRGIAFYLLEAVYVTLAHALTKLFGK